MLQISEHQAAALRPDHDVEFARQIAQFLRETLPAETQGSAPEQLRSFAANCLVGSRQFGLTSLRQAARFSAFELLFGPDFVNKGLPGAAEILDDRSHEPNERLAMLVQLAEQRMGTTPHGK